MNGYFQFTPSNSWDYDEVGTEVECNRHVGDVWLGGNTSRVAHFESNLTAVDPITLEIKKPNTCHTRTIPARFPPAAGSCSWRCSTAWWRHSMAPPWMNGSPHDIRGQRQAIPGNRIRSWSCSDADVARIQPVGTQGDAASDGALRVRAVKPARYNFWRPVWVNCKR